MIWMFLTGAGVLDHILDGPHMLCRSYVSNLVEFFLSLKSSRTVSKMDDIAAGLEDAGCS